MVLLTEIGFLSESLVQGYELKGKSEGEREGATESDTPFPCFSCASACVIIPTYDICACSGCMTVPVRQRYLRFWKHPPTVHMHNSLQRAHREDDVFHANMSHLTFSKNMPPRLIQRLLAWKRGSN